MAGQGFVLFIFGNHRPNEMLQAVLDAMNQDRRTKVFTSQLGTEYSTMFPGDRGYVAAMVSPRREILAPLEAEFHVGKREGVWVEFAFHLYTSIGIDDDVVQIVRMAGTVMRQFDGDCMLLTEDHYVPCLVRRNGHVTLYTRTWGWTADERMALAVAYGTEDQNNALTQ